MANKHFATRAATDLSAAAGPKHAFERRRKPLWKDGPLVSVVGFGAHRLYLSQKKAPQQSAEALLHALRLGVNLIDVSAHALDGQSEILVGQVLAQVFNEGLLKRENLVLVSKVGDVRGHCFDAILSQEMQKSHSLTDGSPRFPRVGDPKLMGFDEALTFYPGDREAVSVDGSVLRMQIESSLRRLGVDCIDLVLFEYPENLLRAMGVSGVSESAARQFLREKMAIAFEALNGFVKEGLIQAFGVVSGTLGYSKSSFERVELGDLLMAAEKAMALENFRVIAFPLNWIELTGLVSVHSESLLEQAARAGLGVLTTRPLNALSRGQLIRLARPKFSEEALLKMTPAEQKGLENWVQLALDLEKLGQDTIAVPGFDGASLSQMVIATLTSLTEVSAVLLGMNQKAYVEDALEALTLPRLLAAQDMLMNIHRELEFETS